jgi:hypothetical protein
MLCKREPRSIPSPGLLQQGNPPHCGIPLRCSQSSDCSPLEDTNANNPVHPYTCSSSYSCFLFEYDTPDGVWSFSLPARDWSDAEEKLRGIRRTGRVMGQIKCVIPALRGGAVLRILCAIRNFFILPNSVISSALTLPVKSGGGEFIFG